MKHWIVCIITLNSFCINAIACGPYYPYGDAIRFSILDPKAFGCSGFFGMNYTASIFYDNDSVYPNEEAGRAVNVLLWKAYCKNKADIGSIYQAVYDVDESELDKTSTGNAMLNYLFTVKDTAAINYLKFAKHCNQLNTWQDDPWERSTDAKNYLSLPFIQQGMKVMATTPDKMIRKRYAFVLMRLAFYSGDEKVINWLYDRYFVSAKNAGDIIDYWALYFKAMTETDRARQNYFFALVFSNAPDKRLGILQHYNVDIPLAATLSYTRNNKEKAAVSLMDNLKNAGKGLKGLMNIYQLQPNSEAFSFLLLREMNKLEDWIYTPYYTYFVPAVDGQHAFGDYEWYDLHDASKFALRHIDKDRAYAQQVLQFVNTIHLNKVQDPVLVKTVKAYLALMTGDRDLCLATIKTIPASAQTAQMIKALCVAGMPNTGAAFTAGIKKVLMEQAALKNNRFVFAFARELEFKGYTTQAALLYTQLNTNEEYDDEKAVYWRTRKNHQSRAQDFYDNYFDYLDVVYTPSQVEAVINAIEQHHSAGKDRFEQWLYSGVSGDIDILYDLLGTKYMRLNNLHKAYAAFENVNDTVWSSSKYSYHDYLDANAFYTNFYAEHKTTKADTVRYTKTTLVAKLLSHLQKANDVKERDRDLHYFLAANCYFNMTEFGNSWMMRRYAWSNYVGREQLPDDAEYHQANLAKQYYLKAMAVAATPQFAALCLRMAGRCEKYRQIDVEDGANTKTNKYYIQLKKKYPGDFEDLISNCYSFEKYFAFR
ncbi:hypothetical protein [Ferruginibacter sp. SUN106]|uniref:hypothetical protein n=1 Tax=Ferruginibacter sp. SUN106 TaxID=2978348 RepID=UPI003D36A948